MQQRVEGLLLVLLILASLRSFSQSTKSPAQPGLSGFSSDQLTACFYNSKICGSSDVWDIANELEHRLSKLPSERLVACYNDWKICGVGEGRASGWPISDELARRGNPEALMMRYWKEPIRAIRNGIEHVAYHFDNLAVISFMRKIIAERVDDGEDRYWPVHYLAKMCDLAALKELSSGRYRNQGSLQYQFSVELFGKCKYRAAIPYLVQTAIRDTSLNIVIAADDSLRALYRDAPAEFPDMEGMQRYFCRRAQQEGFRVRCN
jgi:hypothetical protein